mmetsp:Transcript_38917/g.121574  ORF Transcript_38917/g.121574 Transcript_38917/m.121574 type:complete len:307 (+) Transcript_38917:196-1116(+)
MVSWERPMAPCACIARSATVCTIKGTTNFTIDSSCRAALLPSASILAAARWTNIRAWSISALDLAMSARMVSKSASFLPKAVRDSTRRHMAERERSAVPSNRMQWWILPGPSRACAISKPRPSPARMLAKGTRTSSKSISKCPLGASSSPNTCIGRTRVMPGVSIGTRTMEAVPWRPASAPAAAVLPMKMQILQCRLPAPVIHHLRPLMTYSPAASSRAMEALMFVASLEATAGSVMAKQERIFPSSRGFSQRSFCSAVPKRAIVSMFPVSGDAQFMASAASSMWLEVPMISHREPYWKLERPPPS